MSNVTISSFQPGINWPWGGSTATLRYTYSSDFVDSTGTPILRGLYKDIPCTVLAGVVSVSSHVILSTLDALVNPLVTLNAQFIDYRGTRRSWLFQNFSIPATTPTTIGGLEIFNQGNSLVLPPDEYLTRSMVVALIAIAVGLLNKASAVIYGILRLSVAPASAADPVAMGANDRRVGSAYNVTATAIGAVGNGTTDDRAALNTLVNTTLQITGAGGEVLFPPGTFLIGSDMTFPANVRLSFDPRAKLKPATGVIVRILGAVDAGPYQIFTNATAGLGTISFATIGGVYNERHIDFWSEWWGAAADMVTDSFAAIQAAQKALESQGNGILNFLVGGYLTSAAIQITEVKGIAWKGAGREYTSLTATGGTSAVQCNGIWRSRFESIKFDTNALISGAAAVFEMDGNYDSVHTQGVQGNTFIDCYFQANQLASYAFAVTRRGNASFGGQGSENSWWNCNADGGTVACVLNLGANALNNTWIGGNLQAYKKHGFQVDGGSLYPISVGFQSTFPYDQVVNGGFDYACGTFGAGERLALAYCRSESPQFYQGSATQPCTLESCSQPAIAGAQPWVALTPYTLHQVVMKLVTPAGGVQRQDMFYVKTAGTSGGVEPAWTATPGAEYVDGSVTWKQLDYLVIDTTTIGGGSAANTIKLSNCNFFTPTSIGGWAYSDQFVNGSALTASVASAFSDWSFPRQVLRFDATSADLTYAINNAPIGQIVTIKKVDVTNHTLTIAGGTATIDGAASVVLAGLNQGHVTLICSAANAWTIISKGLDLPVYGAAVTAATAIVPTGQIFHVTGNTAITSITATGMLAGARISIIFDGTPTFTDGNNLKLAGNLVATADDTISLVFDGTNFYETGRSVN